MDEYMCPLCSVMLHDTMLRPVAFMGPYTLTLSCGAVLWTGKPHPDLEMNRTWWNFDDHEL